MRAVVLTGHGGPEVLEVQERPDPPVGPGEVRIAVKAAGINFADTVARVGLYPDAPKTPCVLGYEVAGDFEAEVSRLTDGEGVDVILDALGPTSFRKDYRLLRPGGRLIMYGASEVSTGEKRNLPKALRTLAKSPLATMPWWKGLAVMNEN